jgi:hypothetical protein
VAGEIKPDELFPARARRENDAAITIHQRDATLWIARTAGSKVTIPDASFVHVFVAAARPETSRPATPSASPPRGRSSTPPARTLELVIWETWSDLT